MNKTAAFKKVLNFVLVLLTAYSAVLLYTRWVSKDKRQDTSAPSFEALSIKNETTTLPPSDGKPAVIVFWATWCGPCKLELDRLNAAAEKGEIPMDRIFAVSIGEPLADVQAEASRRKYKFPVFADVEAEGAQAYEVRVTPTTLTLEGSGKIAWISEGLHPLSVRRARQIFQK